MVLGDSNELFAINDNKQINIRIGDINNDSFPDIITTLRSKNNNSTKVRVFTNYDAGSSKRTFNTSEETKNIESSNAYYASFFDLDENGQLDINVVTKDASGKYSIIGYYNNYIYDAFFLKSTTLQAKNNFPTSEIGTNYRYIVTNLNGERRMDVSFQAAQNGANCLALPYAFIGIGRTNNYVENFAVISNTYLSGAKSEKVFTPVIPNSQLLISKVVNDGKL